MYSQPNLSWPSGEKVQDPNYSLLQLVKSFDGENIVWNSLFICLPWIDRENCTQNFSFHKSQSRVQQNFHFESNFCSRMRIRLEIKKMYRTTGVAYAYAYAYTNSGRFYPIFCFALPTNHNILFSLFIYLLFTL